MSGDVFLSELFVRALSHVSATEQIVDPCVGSYGFGIFGATQYVLWYCLSFVLTHLSQADGFKTLDLPCPAFSNDVYAGGIQDLGGYAEEDYGGGAYFEGGYGYAS